MSMRGEYQLKKIISKLQNIKTIHRFIISYIVAFCLPLLVLTYIINEPVIRIIKKNVYNNATSEVARINEQLDAIFFDMQKVSTNIMDNPDLTPYMIRENTYNQTKGISTIRSYVKANNNFIDIFYYLKGDKNIFTSSYLTDLNRLVNTSYKFSSWSYDDLHNILNKSSENMFLPATVVKKDNRDTTIVPYLISDTTNNSTILFVLSYDRLEKLTNLLDKPYLSGFVLFDKQKNPIVTLKQCKINTDELIKKIEFSKEVQIKNIDNKYSAFYLASEFSELSIFALFDNNIILGEINQLRYSLLFILFILFIGGIAWTNFSIQLNYYPIRRLKEKLSNNLSSTIHKDDIKVISDAFEEALQNIGVLSTKVNKHQGIIHKYFISEILTANTKTKSNIMEDEEFLILNNQSNNYIVYIIKILYQDSDNQNNEEYMSILSKEIKEIEPYKADVLYDHEYFENNERVVIISSVFEFDELFKEKFKSLQIKVSSITGVNSVIIIGNNCDNMLSTGQSFVEISSLFKQYMPSGNNEFHSVDYLNEVKEDEYSDIYSRIRALSAKLKMGNAEDIKDEIQEIIENISKRNIPPFIKRCIIYDVINIFLKLLMEKDIENSYKNVLPNKMDTIDEMHIFLNNMVTEVCKYILVDNKFNVDNISEMKRYLNENYNNLNFTVDGMAKAFNFSTPYLSTYFKENTGETVLDYLTKVRIEKAKELLNNRGISINDISTAVGYIDVSTFHRRFKKNCGITPGEYRKQNL